MKFLKFPHFQLFAEEQAAESAEITGVTEADAGPQSEPPAQDSGEFEQLIKGRFKAEYDARVKSILQQRLKGSRETVEKFKALEPTLALLEKKYGVAAGDYGALERAISQEDEQANDTARQAARQQEHAQRVQAGAGRILEGWLRDGEEIRRVYPSFDLRQEMQNPQFTRLLQSHVDLQTAYEIVHKDEIIPAAMAYAAKTVERKLAQNLRSAGSRPTENGSGGGGVLLGNSVSRMSRKEIAEVCRRVERGERISLG